MVALHLIVVIHYEDENYTIVSNPSRDCFVAEAPRNDSRQDVFHHCEQSEAISYFDTRY